MVDHRLMSEKILYPTIKCGELCISTLMFGSSVPRYGNVSIKILLFDSFCFKLGLFLCISVKD